MYLLAYNSASAIAWTAIGVQNVVQLYLLYIGSPDSIYISKYYEDYPHKLLVITQSLNAVFEIGHSILGITKSPVLMTLVQFFARCSITFGICYLNPQAEGNFNAIAFPAMLVAWSLTEMIRYPYYATKLVSEVPDWLDWLRYSAFIVLYPLGLLSEPWVIAKLLPSITSTFQYWFFVIGFSLYIPGFYVLYTYMFKQRSKVLGKQASRDSKKQN